MKTLDLIPFEDFQEAGSKEALRERRSLEQAIKKRMIKKGKGYKLYNLVYNLQDLDAPNTLTEKDLGLVYSSLVLNFPKANYLDELDHTMRGSSLERSFKKRFQELTRVGCYRLYQHLHVGKHQIPDLMNIYEEKLLEKFPQLDLNRGTIEGEVLFLMDNEGFMNQETFKQIGSSFIEGSKDYFNEFRRINNEPKFREYNAILDRLKEITE